ncbi:MAG: serine protease [Mesorhizobium sp.]|nr:S1C family serine protease [Mesorhizobium sp.]MBN9243218.1 serine protease [Mesorhizobium sp.]
MSDFDLCAFSDAVAAVAEAVAPLTASVPSPRGRTATAFHWGDGLYVAAEEVIDPDAVQHLTLPSGETVAAELLGRDPSTGVALLKPAVATNLPVMAKAEAVRSGHMAIAAGRSGPTPLAVLGTVGEVGPSWRSLRGGVIDRRINLAILAGGRFEGGPVLDAKGALVGMLLFGPQRRALVIPYETIERAVATLREKGGVMRGYLGAGLHPIRDTAVSGAIVMSLDDEGPAKAAGIMLGDIVTGWNGEAVRGPRELIRKLGPDSAGAAVTLTVLRAGEAREVPLMVGEKPLG